MYSTHRFQRVVRTSPPHSYRPCVVQVQVPQNAHDGNVDFRWQRGCVFTNKDCGPYPHLTQTRLHARRLLRRSPRAGHDAQTAAYFLSLRSPRQEADLWTHTRKVSPEDVRHMQSRVHLFRCTASVLRPGQEPWDKGRIHIQ